MKYLVSFVLCCFMFLVGCNRSSLMIERSNILAEFCETTCKKINKDMHVQGIYESRHVTNQELVGVTCYCIAFGDGSKNKRMTVWPSEKVKKRVSEIERELAK